MVTAPAARHQPPSTPDPLEPIMIGVGGQEPGGGDERGAPRATMLIRNIARHPSPNRSASIRKPATTGPPDRRDQPSARSEQR